MDSIMARVAALSLSTQIASFQLAAFVLPSYFEYGKM